MQRHLLDRRAFRLDMKANNAKDKEQDDSGNYDAKENNGTLRCLGCFRYPSTSPPQLHRM